MRHRLAMGCLLLFILWEGNAQPQTKAVAQKRTVDRAAESFAKGKELIENNCIDCMGGTRAGMEEGIQEIEAALQGGYRNRKAAYELLSDAYADMSTYTERNPEEEKAYETKRKQIDRKLFELYPNDPAVLQRYETFLDNDTERMEILKRLVKIKPNPDSKFGLGILLMQQRNVNEGLPLVRSAVATQDDPEAVVNYVDRLIEQLGNLGCPLPEAGSWLQKVSAAWDKANRGAGDSNAMPEFKKNFVAELDRTSCKVR